ncbi:MAG TPA: carboxypeptidase-like regulatory domain-containing protein, partial [Pyrinomonadaceae bacterium]
MPRQDSRLESLRVASPCPVSWESMRGNDAVRFCQQCQLNVYDISRMTRPEAEALIAETEGRICARLFRRADGTVLTKDCPVGLRAWRRRISSRTGAALTALLSLLGASAFGQTLSRDTAAETDGTRATYTRTLQRLSPQTGRATLSGTVTDPQGNIVPGAQATLINELTKHKRSVKSDAKGEFKFGLLEPGDYRLQVESEGFQDYVHEHLSLRSNEELKFDIQLMLGGIVGVLVIE